MASINFPPEPAALSYTTSPWEAEDGSLWLYGGTLKPRWRKFASVVVQLENLNIAGATDVGAALTDADLIPLDKAGAGNNRKSAMSRFFTYILSKFASTPLPLSSGGTGANNANDARSALGLTNVVYNDDSRLNNSRTPTSHSHGSITNGGAIGSTANLPVFTGADGVLETATPSAARGKIGLGVSVVNLASGDYEIPIPGGSPVVGDQAKTYLKITAGGNLTLATGIRVPSDSSFSGTKALNAGELYVVKLEYVGTFWMLVTIVGGGQ